MPSWLCLGLVGSQQLGGPGTHAWQTMSPHSEEEQLEGVTHPAQLSAAPVMDPGPAEPQRLVWGLHHPNTAPPTPP